MAALSHIVKADASPFCHGLGMNMQLALLHIVEVDKNAGPNHLAAWREFRKLTQEELAEKVGTTASQISMLETGDRGLSAKWLRRLAPALKTTPGHLLDHDPNTIDNDVFDIWMEIDRRDRETALRVLRSFKTGTHE
jgi:transcriptional regulator with XRE-family HTH domain